MTLILFMSLKSIRQVVFVEAHASDEQLRAEHDDCLFDRLHHQVGNFLLLSSISRKPFSVLAIQPSKNMFSPEGF